MEVWVGLINVGEKTLTRNIKRSCQKGEALNIEGGNNLWLKAIARHIARFIYKKNIPSDGSIDIGRNGEVPRVSLIAIIPRHINRRTKIFLTIFHDRRST